MNVWEPLLYGIAKSNSLNPLCCTPYVPDALHAILASGQILVDEEVSRTNPKTGLVSVKEFEALVVRLSRNSKNIIWFCQHRQAFKYWSTTVFISKLELCVCIKY